MHISLPHTPFLFYFIFLLTYGSIDSSQINQVENNVLITSESVIGEAHGREAAFRTGIDKVTYASFPTLRPKHPGLADVTRSSRTRIPPTNSTPVERSGGNWEDTKVNWYMIWYTVWGERPDFPAACVVTQRISSEGLSMILVLSPSQKKKKNFGAGYAQRLSSTSLFRFQTSGTMCSLLTLL